MKVLTTRAASDALGLPAKTLEHWRLTGQGPVYLKLGGRVYYTEEDLREWMASSRRRSTSDAGAAA